jgi:hypothetical protein
MAAAEVRIKASLDKPVRMRRARKRAQAVRPGKVHRQ